MRLILNPEIDVLWRDKTTLQVRNPDGTNNTISDLPSEMKLIISSCTGIINISDILMNLNIDERIHEDINVALRFLIEHQILINQTHLFEQSEKLHKSYVQILGINTFAYQIGHLLASAGVGRVVFDSLVKKHSDVSLGDINIFGPKAKEIGTSLAQSLRDSLLVMGTRAEKPNVIVLTTLASSLLVTNCISYLTGELVNSGPSLLNVVCDLDAIGPTIIFRKLQPNPQCGCRWEAA